MRIVVSVDEISERGNEGELYVTGLPIPFLKIK